MARCAQAGPESELPVEVTASKFTGEPPRVDTDRLYLTPHAVADLNALAAMWADPEVVRHIGGKISTRSESWMRLVRYRGLWPLLGYGYWAMRERETGRYVGEIGFADFHREMEPSIAGIPEAGWVLARWAHGRGFASEALAAACRWLDDQTGFSRSVCIVTPENAASLRVAEKNGFVERLPVVFRNAPCLLLARKRPRG